MLLAGATFSGGVFLIPLAAGLAGAVARERQRQTLEVLLTLPAPRQAILRAKVRAVLERWWWLGPVTVLATGLSFGADGGWPLGLAAAGFSLAGAWLVVGWGAWLTIRCPTEVWAFRLLMPAVVLVFGAPVGVWNWTDWREPTASVAGLAAGAAAFAVAGTLAWRRACRALEQAA